MNVKELLFWISEVLIVLPVVLLVFNNKENLQKAELWTVLILSFAGVSNVISHFI